jgi:hypothetical protein
MKKDLGFIDDLSDGNRNRGGIACRNLLQRFQTTEDNNNVMFSDECAIYLSLTSKCLFLVLN